MRTIFVTGIGTGVGKTVVSAIVAEALRADYWKPIQCGDLESSDSRTVAGLLSNSDSRVHEESLRLRLAASPHYAAEQEGISITPESFARPVTQRDLVVEGAGGLLVPLAKGFLVADLAVGLGAEVLLVSRNYLGSLNHTLLTVEALRTRGLAILGIVFNGDPYPSGERFLLDHTGLEMIGRVREERELTADLVRSYAAEMRARLRRGARC